ncbi:hypothetical protein [Aquimarina hainanensis]
MLVSIFYIGIVRVIFNAQANIIIAGTKMTCIGIQFYCYGYRW